MRTVIVDTFSAVELPRRAKGGLTYETFRAAVLAAGRFSAFEATDSMRLARWYTRLCNSDSEVVTDNKSIGFPWTLVRLKTDAEKRAEIDASERRRSLPKVPIRYGVLPDIAPERGDRLSPSDPGVEVHMAHLMHERNGSVSPLCASSPRPLKERETWTFDRAGVTCERCRVALKSEIGKFGWRGQRGSAGA